MDVWFSNSALKSNTLKKIKFYWNFIELYSSQNGCGHVCPLLNVTACKLMEETAIKGFPSHYSICSYQLKSQMKNIWLKANVLYQQLLSSVAVSHTQRCVYDLCILNNPSIYLVKNWIFSSNLISFSHWNYFFREFSLSANLV